MRTISWLLWITALVALWWRPSAAAVNCSVSQLPDGSFLYQLSESMVSPGCSTCWEDHNRFVIARDSEFNLTLVEKLTDESIQLKICQHHLRHMTDCFRPQREVDCRVNCSLFDTSDRPPATRFCFSEALCFDPLPGGLMISALAAALILIMIVSFAIYKRRRRTSADVKVSYEAAATTIQMEEPSAKTQL